MSALHQPSLSGGELAPSLQGRVDIEKYRTSVKTCYNMIPQAYGGVKNRQGTRFIANAYASGTTSRLVPFSFNSDQNYVLEICGATSDTPFSGHLRIMMRGALVLYGPNEAARLGVTQNTPVTLAVPWKIGDVRSLKFSQSADTMTVTHPSYRPYQILRKSEDRWEIREMPFAEGPWEPENIAKGKTVWTDKNTKGQLVTLSSTSPIFLGKEGSLFKITQAGFSTAWETGVSPVVGDIRRSDAKYYRLVRYEPGQTITGTLRPSHDDGNWSDGKAVWEYLHPGWGCCTITSVLRDGYGAYAYVNTRLPDESTGQSPAVGAPNYIDTVAQSPAGAGGYTQVLVTITGGTLTALPGETLSARLDITYLSSTGASTNVSFNGVQGTVSTSTTVVFDLSWDSFGITNTSQLTLDTETSDSTFSLYTPNSNVVGNAVMTHKWAFGAWGAANGWPTCSAYFQQRHVFAGSVAQPQTVWASKTGDFGNFGVANPLQDDDALEFTVASAQIDGIKSMLPLDKLVMFTLGGNWVTTSGGQTDAISPSNIGVRLQNYYGSSDLPPLGIGNTALYYGRNGTVRDMAYEFANDSYTGNDLATTANHLLADATVYEWDFQQAPFPIVWMVRNDGRLLALTYLKEQQVVGWSQHDLTGIVESVAVISECGEDHVYLCVKRGSARHLECLYGRVDDEYEACFVDAASTYDGRSPGGTVTITGTYSVGGTVTVTSSSDIFVSGAGDEGDQIVIEDASGVQYRMTLNVGGYSTTKIRTATVGSVAIPVSLQGTPLGTWAFARDTFTGLTQLANTAVSVYSEGTYASGTVSAGGVLTLASCSPALGPSFICTVGLPITAIIEPLNVSIPGNQGPLVESRKLISTVSLMVENSRSCYIGPTSSTLYEATVKTSDDVFTAKTHASGIIEVSIPSTWNTNGVFYLKHTKPYPLSILGLLPDVEVGG